MALLRNGDLVPQKGNKEDADVEAAVNKLDLQPIALAVQRECHWATDKMKQIELRYRRFLFMAATSGKVIIPSKDVDTFWHHHILDTHKYADDCHWAFGFYLHHCPGFGTASPAEFQKLQVHYVATSRLYVERYHEPYEYIVPVQAPLQTSSAGSSRENAFYPPRCG